VIPDLSYPKPKVVILLATRNGADFLQQQLESYRAQTYDNWELLVSDDGSTDETVAIINAFAQTAVQRVILRQGPQLGFWQNFASLVRSNEAEGDFIAYSDQDDIWFPEKLATAVAWLKTHPVGRPALYFARTELIETDGAPAGFSPLFKRAPTFQNALVQSIGGGNTMVFNHAGRQVLRATPVNSALVSHDWWTYQLITGVGGVAHYDPWPCLKYRQHGKNLVGSNVGWRARIVRLMAFAKGRLITWNDINLKVLDSVKNQLAPESIVTLERYAKARHASSPTGLWLMWTSGVYRQSRIETLGLFAAAIFGKL
jgi:glycosyltransferase involved in cell wall biosynthesis